MKMKITTTVVNSWKNVVINQLKYNYKNFVDDIVMLRFGETKVAKEKFYGTKKPIYILDVNVDNIVVSKIS